MRPPLPRPPFGLHTRIEVVRVIDGDTLEVQGQILREPFRVRLLNVDAPELRSDDPQERVRAVRALDLVRRLVMKRKDLSLFIPLPEGNSGLLDAIGVFRRVLGHVYLDEQTLLSDELVREGVARWSSR